MKTLAWRPVLDQNTGVGNFIEIRLFGSVFLLSLLVYLRTLYPTVAGGDSGELVTSAWLLGIAHPPGYPLHTLLGALFAQLPWGSVAWRVGLLSGFCDALAAAFLALSVRGWTARSWAGFLAGGLFAFSPLVWTHAVSAEVFALNNLLLAASLYVCVSAARTPGAGRAALLLFLAALGISNHHASIFFTLPLCLWLLSDQRARERPLALTAATLAGFAPYLYLPLSARLHPSAPGWGDPGGLAGFLTHFFRGDYGTFQLVKSDGPSDTDFLAALFAFGGAAAANLLFVGLPLAAYGAVDCARRSLGKVLLASLLAYLAVFHALANLPLTHPVALGVLSRFWQQPLLVLTFWTGIAAAALAGKAGLPSRASSRALWIPALALAGLQLLSNFRAHDQHGNRIFEKYAQAAIRPLPPGAILLVRGDTELNTLQYFHSVEGLRPDVKLLDLEAMTYPWYRRMLPAGVTLPGPTYDLAGFLDANLGTAPVFALGGPRPEDRSWIARHELVPHGLTRQFRPRGEKRDPDLWVRNLRAALPADELASPAELERLAPGAWERVLAAQVCRSREELEHYLRKDPELRKRAAATEAAPCAPPYP